MKVPLYMGGNLSIILHGTISPPTFDFVHAHRTSWGALKGLILKYSDMGSFNVIGVVNIFGFEEREDLRIAVTRPKIIHEFGGIQVGIES